MARQDDLKRSELLCAESVRELIECDRVEVESSEIGVVMEGADDLTDVLTDLPGWDGVVIDSSLQQCAMRFSEISGVWRTVGDLPYLGGEFCVPALGDALLEPPPALAWEGSPESERRLFSELRVIDSTPRSGAGFTTGIRVQPGVPTLEIWHLDPRIGPQRMDIDYCDYLSVLQKTKGCFGWQYLYCEVQMTDYRFQNHVDSITRMLDRFPVLFPGADYSDLARRFEERR